MPPSPGPVLPGTLEFLILQSLRAGERHGLGVARRVEQITKGTFAVKAGSLFPALHRMERAGWVTSFWGESDNRRKARFYRLTARGRRQLDVEATEWRRVVVALTAALGAGRES